MNKSVGIGNSATGESLPPFIIHNDINKCACIVIPAKAGIQLIQIVLSRHRRDCFRRGDGFSEFCKNLI